jgi:hypothetical protein
MPTITRTKIAADFVGSLGINTQAAMQAAGYTNSSLVIRSLDYLGIDRVRDVLIDTGTPGAVLDAMADAGVTFDFRVPYSLPAKGASGLASYLAQLRSFLSEHPGSLNAVEGINEANMNSFSYGGDSSLSGAAAFQKALYAAINSSATLGGISVYNTTVAYSGYSGLGNLRSAADAANVHLYLGTGGPVDSAMQHKMAEARAVSTGHPLVVSEIGHPTLRTEPGIGVSQKAQAKTMLSELLLAYENGAARTYIYELFDNSKYSSSDKEHYFGLFTTAGNAKPAATALHNLTTILTKGANGTANGVVAGWSLETGASNVHAMSLEKTSTVYDIAVWRDTPVWNDAENQDYRNPAHATVVDLGRVEGTVKVYDPLAGTSPIASYSNVSSVKLSLRDSPYVIEVGAVAQSIAAPAATRSLSAAQFVAQVDALSSASGLQKVTLTDTQVLPVSSASTMHHLIAEYTATLAKVSGGYSFAITETQTGFRRVTTYDAKGAQTLRTDDVLDDGVTVSRSVFHADGTRDNTRYHIAGEAYATEHQQLDAKGKLMLLERLHADGSAELRDERHPDGSRLYATYTSAGKLETSIATAANGSRVTAIHETGGDVRTDRVATDGTLLTRDYAHADGSHDFHAWWDGQTLRGGSQDDTFDFHRTGGGRMIYDGGDDTVVNFGNVSGTGSERISIGDEWASRYGDLQMTQKGSDVLVDFGGDDSILIQKQTIAHLTPDLFLFA